MDKIKFTLENINLLAKSISENSIIPYEELPQYDLFLSQVIDYLNDKFEDDNYTNNIVQNYIKSEVISKPEDSKKRGYTKLHLAQLVLLSHMRPVLTSEEIKKVFRLAFNEINDRDDDIISWEDAYKFFSDMQKQSFNDFQQKEFCDKAKLETIINTLDLKESDEERISVFLVVMTFSISSKCYKKISAKDCKRL